MAISLYDPASQSIQTFSAGTTFELATAAVEGGPSELSALRKAVLSDVLQRQAPTPVGTDAVLDRLLADVVRGALRDQYERETLRLWLLEAHYRTPLVLEESGDQDATRHPALDQSERRLAHLYATQRRLAELPAERIAPVQTAPSDALLAVSDALRQALESDLNTPEALAVVDGLLVAVNALCDAALRKHGHINRSAVEAAEVGFATVSRLLGLGAEQPARSFLLRVRNRRAKQQRIDVIAVERKVAERAAARAARDFERADALQAELSSLGVGLLDGPSGTSWTLS